MSLFYKNQQQKPSNNLQNQDSVVRPYKEPEHAVVAPFYKPTQSQMVIQKKSPVVDPTFAHRPAAPQSQNNGLRGSVLLSNGQNQKQSWWSKCCSCTKLQTYQKFFKVTNGDVRKRICHSLQFWQSGFFSQGQQYDFYGPFWIYTTVVFCLSAVSNILLYQGSTGFDYNFQLVGLAFGFIYLEGFLFPVILTFILKMLGVNCTYLQNICIYGYSLCSLLICLLLCSINVCILHFILLGYAFATKALFIINNMFASYAIPIPKKALITALVAGEAALQFFVIKFFFINCVNDQPATPTAQKHLIQNFYYHVRNFVY